MAQKIGTFVVDFAVEGDEVIATSIKKIEKTTKDAGNRMKSAFGSISDFGQKAFFAIQGVSSVFNTMSGLYDKFISDTIEARKQIQQLTGATGAELDTLTSKAQATAQVYKQEVSDVTAAANTLSREMGVGFDDAINIINRGFSAGANASGEFLEQLKEYPTQFAAAGLSAEEMTAFIAESTRQGIFSDKGADLVKETLLRVREMPDATRQAIEGIGLSADELLAGMQDGSLTAFQAVQKVAGRLGELPETSEKVGTAIADIFGGAGEDAGLRFITMLDDMELSLGDVNSEQQAQLTLSENYNMLLNKIAPTVKGIANFFVKIAAYIVETKPLLYVLAGAIGAVTIALIALKVSSIAASIAVMNIPIVGWILAIVAGIVALGAAAISLAGGWAKVWDYTKTFFVSLKDIAKSIIGGVIDLLGGLGRVVKKLFSLDFSGAADEAKKTFSKVKENASDMSATVGDNFAELGEKYKRIEQEKAEETEKQNERIVLNTQETGKAVRNEYQQTADEIRKLEDLRIGNIIDEHERELAEIDIKYKREREKYSGNQAILTELDIAWKRERETKLTEMEIAQRQKRQAEIDELEILQTEIDDEKKLVLRQKKQEEEAVEWTQFKEKKQQHTQKEYEEEAKRLAIKNKFKELRVKSDEEYYTGVIQTVAKGTKAQFVVEKGAAIKNAVVNVYRAISEANTLPFPMNIIEIIRAGALGWQQVSSIKATSYATGAVVDSPTLAIVGDAKKAGAKTNKELILNDPLVKELAQPPMLFESPAMVSGLSKLNIVTAEIRDLIKNIKLTAIIDAEQLAITVDSGRDSMALAQVAI